MGELSRLLVLTLVACILVAEVVESRRGRRGGKGGKGRKRPSVTQQDVVQVTEDNGENDQGEDEDGGDDTSVSIQSSEEQNDPCATVTCDPNASCNKGICTCNPGYTGDGFSCQQEQNDPCANVTCDPNASCNEGICTCNPGYTGDGFSCQQDLCDGVTCGSNAVCDATTGQCVCLSGYEMAAGSTNCTNIDECSGDRDPFNGCPDNPYCNDCSLFSRCIDSDGSYTCECFAGYVGDGHGVDGCVAAADAPVALPKPKNVKGKKRGRKGKKNRG